MFRRHEEMPGMDMSSSNMSSSDMSTMDVSAMRMTFFASSNTPLYSDQWTPHTVGQYAATCIFLIALAVAWRALFAAKAIVEERWLAQALQRHYVVVAGQTPESERIKQDASSSPGTLMVNGVEQKVMVTQQQIKGPQPWRFSVDLPRALLATVIAGVGWLLMLAIMTLNVGYFMSILGGTFLGEVLVGRYVQGMAEH
ncbi:low affinity copper transporter [Phyllosticta citricarpa]|uniref:Copper transport protein n=2 Tax=Phyllosticta TaxID=121621 RepID=A0ABR1MIX3_9PEZI